MRSSKVVWLLFVSILAGLPAAQAAVSIQRMVEVDDFVGASAAVMPERDCGGLRLPEAGDTIRITLGEHGARRDEAAVSFLYDSRSGLLFVVDRSRRTFSKIKPPLQDSVFGEARKVLGKDADHYSRLSLEGAVSSASDPQGKTHRATVANGYGYRYDVGVTYAAQETDAARHGAVLEQLVQQLRHSGSDWISVLPAARSPILALEEGRHQPDVKIWYREKFAKLQEVEADAGLLSPPAGYKKVDFPIGCLSR